MLEQKTTIELQGSSIINGESRIEGGANFQGVDPATGARLEPVYRCASIEDLNVAADLADEAFAVYRKLAGKERARFLRHVADGIEAIVPELVERAHRETALPEARLKGESARTINQLRLFAQVVEDGSWVNARIDPAQPDRKPLPRSDIRSMMKPLGPVAVFGASNFPLAFSVAGGDTAAAFAAGCPVIVKAHHAHPGTSEMVGQVIARSVKECGLPAGVFALLFGAGSEIGAALVDHPKVKAVGFTGSLGAGRALMQRAAARPEPIPCFMEMSSVNPVFVLPEALHKRGGQIAGGLFGSFTLGVGQFCTKPGLVYLPRNADADALIAELKAQTERGAASPMLTGGIAKSYHSGITGRQAQSGVETVAQAGKDGAGDTYAAPVVMQVSAGELLGDPELATEVFGPSDAGDPLRQPRRADDAGGIARRAIDGDAAWFGCRPGGVRRSDCSPRAQSGTADRERLSDGRGGLSRDGARRALSRDERQPGDFSGYVLDLQVRAAGLLPGFSAGRATG